MQITNVEKDYFLLLLRGGFMDLSVKYFNLFWTHTWKAGFWGSPKENIHFLKGFQKTQKSGKNGKFSLFTKELASVCKKSDMLFSFRYLKKTYKWKYFFFIIAPKELFTHVQLYCLNSGNETSPVVHTFPWEGQCNILLTTVI